MNSRSIIIAAVSIAIGSLASAQTVFFTNQGGAGDGLWSTAANWTDGSGTPSGVAPNSGTVAISDDQTVTVDFVATGVGENLGILRVGARNASNTDLNGTLILTTGGFIDVNTVAVTRAGDPTSQGFFDHAGGTLSVGDRLLLGDAPGVTSSVYTISGNAILDGANAQLEVGSNNNQQNTFFNVVGSSVSISSFSYLIDSGANQTFTADTSGLSTINTGEIDLASGALDIDLNSLTIASNASYTLINGTSGLDDVTDAFSSTNIDFSGNSSIVSASIVYDLINDDVVLNVVAVPEPSTYALLAGAIALGLVAIRRRRS